MEQPKKARELLFGRIALDLKFITPEQLTKAVKLQEEQKGKRLGEILLDIGMLSQEQVIKIISVQEDGQKRRIEFLEEKGFDLLFGQVALRYGFLDENQLNEALRMQAKREEKGELFMRLGEIMVDKGFMNAGEVITVLGVQNGTAVVCRKCRTRHAVPGGDTPPPDKCSKCGEKLDPPLTTASPRANYGKIEGFSLDDE